MTSTPHPFEPQTNARNFIALDDIRIASPCRADWNLMSGDDRTRFCQSCSKHVYNLAHMTRAQAQALILEKEGNVCVRLYRRQDGTIITDDCPVGIKIVRRPLKWLLAGFAALFASGAAVFGQVADQASGSTATHDSPLVKLRAVQPFKTLVSWIEPIPQDAPPPVAGGIMPAPPVPCPPPEEKEEAQ